MRGDKIKLFSAFNASVQELHRGIDTHRCLMSSILERQIDNARSTESYGVRVTELTKSTRIVLFFREIT